MALKTLMDRKQKINIYENKRNFIDVTEQPKQFSNDYNTLNGFSTSFTNSSSVLGGKSTLVSIPQQQVPSFPRKGEDNCKLDQDILRPYEIDIANELIEPSQRGSRNNIQKNYYDIPMFMKKQQDLHLESQKSILDIPGFGKEERKRTRNYGKKPTQRIRHSINDDNISKFPIEIDESKAANRNAFPFEGSRMIEELQKSRNLRQEQRQIQQSKHKERMEEKRKELNDYISMYEKRTQTKIM